MKSADIIGRYLADGVYSLSEYDSKRIFADYGLAVAKEELAATQSDALKSALNIGLPVVMKGIGPEFAHKSELGLVRVGVASEEAVVRNFRELDRAMDGRGRVLIQQVVSGARELMIGAIRDEQFGPVVSFGLGGVFAEILDDVSMRVAPMKLSDAEQMLEEIRANRILGSFRGLPCVNRSRLAQDLVAIGQLCLDHPEISEIDINPLIVSSDRAIAVDGLIVLSI